jgi:hypothetical protein
VFSGDDRYLEVKVTNEILAPRTKINSVGYALQAAAVTGLSNVFSTSGNVGIGTLGPVYPLNILKDGTQVGTTNYYILANLRSGNSTKGVSLGYDSSSQTSILGSDNANSNLAFWTHNTTDKWTEKMRILSNGYVGIGTTAPGNLLHIYKTSGSDQGLHITNTGTYGPALLLESTDTGGRKYGLISSGSANNTGAGKLFLWDFTASAARLLVDVNGNIGIGTTNPGGKLEVAGGASGQNTGVLGLFNNGGTGAGSGASIQFYNYDNTPAKVEQARIGALLTDGGAGLSASSLAFSTNFNGTLSEKLRIQGNGLVGIGMTNPSFNLVVMPHSFGATIAGNDPNVESRYLFINNNEANAGLGRNVKTRPGQWLNPDPALNSCFVDLDWNGNIVLSTRTGGSADLAPGTAKIYVRNDGKIGVGITNPMEKLDLGGSIGTTGGNLILGTFQAAVSRYVGIGCGVSGNFAANSGFSGIEFGGAASTSEGYLAFHSHDAGVSSGERIRIDKSGNVGINTTNPQTPLHIKGVADSSARIRLEDSSGGSARGGEIYGTWGGNGLVLNIFGHSSGHIYYGMSDGNVDQHHFYVDGTEKMTLNSSGLTVAGAVSKVSGTFDIPNPNPAKAKDGWRLRHSFVESPTRGDNIYRWTVDVKAGEAVVSMPDYFSYLNENVQVWVSPRGHFGNAFGEASSDLKQITIKADIDGKDNVLARGTRKDQGAKDGFDALGLEYQK